jgi:PAS domain S-box-containing protein
VPQAGATGEEVAQALLAAIIASSNDAIASKTLDGIVTSWNSGAERLFGYSAEEMMGRPIAILGAPGREAEMPMILERIRQGQRVEHFDTIRRRKDGSLVEISLTVSPVRDSAGRIIGASKIARDISERRLAEEQQRLLVAELDHRVKNTLAVVHSLAARSLTAGGERQALLGRLQALINALELLSLGKWRAADLAALVRAELAAYSPRIEMTGQDLPHTARAAQTLALVLHELVANAAQHGALSVPEGRVELAWRVSGNGTGPSFRLSWKELGGPAAGPPRAGGFGRTLLERAPRHDLQADTRLAFEETGLVYTLTAPLEAIAARI